MGVKTHISSPCSSSSSRDHHQGCACACAPLKAGAELQAARAIPYFLSRVPYAFAAEQQAARRRSGLAAAEVQSVEVVGGGGRAPTVQAAVSKVMEITEARPRGTFAADELAV